MSQEMIVLLHEGDEGTGFWGAVLLGEQVMKEDIPALYRQWREEDEERKKNFPDWLCERHRCTSVDCDFVRFGDWDDPPPDRTAEEDPFQWWRDDEDD